MTDTVVLFTGHRVDEPGRTPPRFPPECETKVRLAIESVMKGIAAAARGPVLGIAGAADGGDILFHEVCEELGIESEVCLALPAAVYVNTSVQVSWTVRFHHLVNTHPLVALDLGCDDVWLRDHQWQLRRARERHARRSVLVALLEAGAAYVPDGTSGMVHMAQEGGLEVIRLDAHEICR